MELRPYQQEAKDAIFEQWDSGVLKTLLVLPTGCGKTVVFAKVTEDCVRQGSRVLILAHRGELLDQAADKLKKTTGLGCAVEKAESSCQGTWFRVVVGSVQTLMREKRLNSFPSDYFDTIIIDEAHHCISDSYQRVLQHFSGAHVLGVTATPDRGDMKNLGTYFESLAYEYTLPKAIKEGYLSPIKALTIAIYGTLLVDDEIEEDGEQKDDAEAAMKHLKKRKLLEMPDGTKAEYLTRTFDEAGVEILKKAVEQDIHKFSHIPCMTDESFGGNVSGVAMEFKLLGMENITKIKTRYYRKGLRKRIRIFCRFLSMKEKIVDPEGITMTFTRALPKNLLEISQMVSNLKGIVSQKTLLAQIPFVEDVDEEMAAVKKESEESLKQQQEMFGMQGNDPPEENDPDKSSQKKTEEKKVDE